MRVLLATDGSDDATAAAEWLPHLPFPPDREVMVIAVVEPPSRRWPGTPDSGSGLREGLIADARRLADDTASRLLTGRTSTGRVVEGDPRDEIVTTARDWEADVVVLGTRGLGAARGLLLGSVSLGVARNAPCPVVVCKGLPRAVRTVTVALDGSEHARLALDWLCRLPLASTLRLRLVGVAESAADLASAVREGLAAAAAEIGATRLTALERELRSAAETVRARVSEVDVTLTTGAPADQIVDQADGHGSDLLVVGARGAGLASRLLLGSVSEAVLRQAGCPVVVVRSGTVRRAG